MKKQKRIAILATAAAVLIAGIAWIAWGNTALELNVYTLSSDRLPDAFDGYRIAHISDLHNTEMGDGNEKLLSLLREASPDIICITGDLVDSRNTDIGSALAFVQEAVMIAPCYYVTGNHEARLSKTEYMRLDAGLAEAGVTLLHDREIILEKSGQRISLIGLVDHTFHGADTGISGNSNYPVAAVGRTMVPENIKRLSSINAYTILLSHRPEYFAQYAQADIDLVLSGHAHGGQFRLPFVGGLAAPDQGLFPQYDAGLFTDGSTNMIVSRGIGNSIFPFRFNNRPEVVLIELHSLNQ